MYVFIIIIFLVFLVHLNNKVNSLEALIKNKNITKPEATPVPASVSVPVSTTTIPSSVDITSEVKAQDSKIEKDISGEEVSGRILGRLGIAAVIIGMAFFLKYAFDNGWVPPAGRVAIGMIIGVITMVLGQWLRKKYLQYSDLLMGGGLAILYLSVFSAHALYNLIDPMMALLGMIVITVIGVIISIVNATIVLSTIAIIGGFLAPFLIGVTVLGPWIAFTYITILNAGTLGILINKKWPKLVLISFLGTWLYFGTWLLTSYNDTLLIPTLIFILVQFFILTASPLVRIIIEKAKATEIDYFVLGATALSFAYICYDLLMPQYKHFVSVGSVMVSAFYVIISLMAYRENPEDRTINIFLPGLAVAFITVAVPIEFSGPWIAAWWFVESLVLYTIASKSSSRGFQVMGVVVYMLGLMNLFYYILTYRAMSTSVIFWNGPFIMTMMAVVAAYIIAFIYYKYGSSSPEIQKRGMNVFVILANILTLYALTIEINKYYDMANLSENVSNTAISILWALYATLLTVIGFIKRYASIRRMGLVLFIITAFKVVTDVWSLGEIYRIVSFIVFGIIALTASFIYVRYRDRLKDIV